MKIGTNSFSLVEDLQGFLAPDLANVEAYITSVVESNTELVREVGSYILTARGKRLRPMVVTLVARALGYRGDDHAKVAAAIELVHTATLVHDDVIDGAKLRRGRATVNAKWGSDVAILIADYLYSRAFHLALQVLENRALSAITEVTAQMCEGEMFQIEKRGKRLNLEDYLRIVRHKTAYLFGASAGLGAALAGADDEQIKAVGIYGVNFGVAFQITDDILDLTAVDRDLGKTAGTDIETGKQTLPIIHAMESAPDAERMEFWAYWNNGREAKRVMEFVERHRGLEQAREDARRYTEEAKDSLAGIVEGREKDYLRALCDHVLERTR